MILHTVSPFDDLKLRHNRGDYEDARQEMQEVPITAKGSVQQMWDTIKDRVIGLPSR